MKWKNMLKILFFMLVVLWHSKAEQDFILTKMVSKGNCVASDEDDYCKLCQNGYFYDPFTYACLQCPDDCQNCQSNGSRWSLTLSCQSQSFMMEDGVAAQCMENCLKCSSQYNCNQCKNGYYYDEFYNCGICTTEFCQICTKKHCEKCLDGYYLIGSECFPCQNQINDCEACLAVTFDGDTKIFCSKCKSNLILNPDLTKCENVIENCDGTYYADKWLQIVFPALEQVKYTVTKTCYYCKEGYYYGDSICKGCEACGAVCEKGLCNECSSDQGKSNGSCQDCTLLTENSLCQQCTKLNNDIQMVWICHRCIKGYYLLQNQCVICKDGECESNQAASQVLDDKINSEIYDNDFYANQRFKPFDPSLSPEQISQLQLYSPQISAEKIKSYVIIDQDQPCPIGCDQCSFNVRTVFGKCTSCAIGYTKMEDFCLSNQYDDVFKFSSTISIDCETTRLSDISQLVEESDLYKISKFVNILEFYLTITIAKGSTCILTDSLKIGGFLDRLQNNINSIIIIQGELETERPTIVCWQDSDCLTLVGFSSLMIQNLQFLYQYPVRKESYIIRIINSNTPMEQMIIYNIILSSGIIPDSSSILYRSLIKIQVETFSTNSYLKVQNILIEKINLQCLIYIDSLNQIPLAYLLIQGLFQDSSLMGTMVTFSQFTSILKLDLTDTTFKNCLFDQLTLMSVIIGTLNTEINISNLLLQTISLQNSMFIQTSSNNLLSIQQVLIDKCNFWNSAFIQNQGVGLLVSKFRLQDSTLQSDKQFSLVYTAIGTFDTIISQDTTFTNYAFFDIIAWQIGSGDFALQPTLNIKNMTFQEVIVNTEVLLIRSFNISAVIQIELENFLYLNNANVFSENEWSLISMIQSDVKLFLTNVIIQQSSLSNLVSMDQALEFTLNEILIDQNVDTTSDLYLFWKTQAQVDQDFYQGAFSFDIFTPSSETTITSQNIQDYITAMTSTQSNRLLVDSAVPIVNLIPKLLQIYADTITLSGFHIKNMIISNSFITIGDCKTMTVTNFQLTSTSLIFSDNSETIFLSITSNSATKIQISSIVFADNQIYPALQGVPKSIAYLIQLQCIASDVSLTNIDLSDTMIKTDERFQLNALVTTILPMLNIESKSAVLTNSNFKSKTLEGDRVRILAYLKQELTIKDFISKLSLISSTFIGFRSQAQISISLSTFQDSLSPRTGGIYIERLQSTEGDPTITISDVKFHNLISLQSGASIDVGWLLAQKLIVNILNSSFYNSVALQSQIFTVDNRLSQIKIVIKNCQFEELFGNGLAVLIDLQQSVASSTDQSLTLNDIDQSMAFFQYQLSFQNCEFQTGSLNYLQGNLFWQGSKLPDQPPFISGNTIALFLNKLNCHSVYYLGLISLEQSYLAVTNSVITKFIWRDTYFSLFNSYVYLNNLVLSQGILCHQSMQCSLLDFDTYKTQIDYNQTPQIGQVKETFDQLIVVQDLQYLLFKVIGHQYEAASFIVHDIFCDKCENPVIAIYYSAFKFSNFDIQNITSYFAVIYIQQNIDKNSTKLSSLIEHSLFKNNVGQQLINIASGCLELRNTSVLNNIAYAAPLLYVSQQNPEKTVYLTIMDSIFSFNIGYRTGAILVEDVDTTPIPITINHTKFINNQGMETGAITSKNQVLNLTNCTFNNNKGNIELSFKNNKLQTSLPDVKGRFWHDDYLQLPNRLKFTYLGQVIKPDAEPVLSVNSHLDNSLFSPILISLYQTNNEMIIFEQLSASLRQLSVTVSYDDLPSSTFSDHDEKNESFELNKFSIIKDPGSKTKMFFKLPITSMENVTYTLNFLVRECVRGEILQQVFCVLCEEKSYTLDNLKCLDCPPYAICPGGAGIFLEPGQWRFNATTDILLGCLTQFNLCKGDLNSSNIDSSALFTNFTSDRYCSTGFIGPLCETCDIQSKYWGQSYFQQFKYSCVPCSKSASQIGILVVILIWTVLSIFYSIIRINVDHRQDIERDYLRKAGFLLGNVKDISKSASSVYKILLMHYQILSVILLTNLTVPPAFQQTFSGVSNQLNIMVSSIDCEIAKRYDLNEIPLVFYQLILSLVIPLSISAFFIFFILCGRILGIIKAMSHFIVSGLIFILIVFQPQIMLINVKLLLCRTILDEDFIEADLTQKCLTTIHKQFIGFLIVPTFLIFIVSFFLYFGWVFFKNRALLSTVKFRMMFGFLHTEYKEHSTYWEFLKIAQKLLIYTIASVFEASPVLKIILLCLALNVYFILCNYKNPYMFVKLTTLEQVSQQINLSILFLTIIVISSDQSEGLNVFYMTYVTVINAIWMLAIFKLVIFKSFWAETQNTINETISKQKEKKSKYDCINKCFTFLSLLVKEERHKNALFYWTMIQKGFQDWSELSKDDKEFITFPQMIKKNIQEYEMITNQPFRRTSRMALSRKMSQMQASGVQNANTLRQQTIEFRKQQSEILMAQEQTARKKPKHKNQVVPIDDDDEDKQSDNRSSIKSGKSKQKSDKIVKGQQNLKLIVNNNEEREPIRESADMPSLARHMNYEGLDSRTPRDEQIIFQETPLQALNQIGSPIGEQMQSLVKMEVDELDDKEGKLE